jgi:protein-S-isoprenylcysteine O-methyltransferase Ste14
VDAVIGCDLVPQPTVPVMSLVLVGVGALLFANLITAIPGHVAAPVLWVVLVGLGALVFTNLVVVLPGRSAARTSTALVLRAE